MAASAQNSSHKRIESYVPGVRLQNGIYTDLPFVNASTGTSSFAGPLTVTGPITGPGGQVQTGSVQSTVFHSGGVVEFGALTTNYSQTKFSTTTSYFCEVFIPDNATLTGIAVLNGGTTSASGNTFVGLANAAGTIVASSNTTTAQGTANAYQQIPFSTTYSAIGPGKYFIVIQNSATTGYFGSHTVGNYSASSKTSETYGTFTSGYATTTFTASVGPIADTY